MRAVITAGGTVDGAFAHAIGTTVKALAPWGGRTLLDVAIDACAQAGIDDVAVVGDGAVHAYLAGRGLRLLPGAPDGESNVVRALDAWLGERYVYLTSDLPFANGTGLRELVARSAPFALAMGLADSADYAARFPGARPAGVRLRGERVVNACAFVVGPEAVAPLRTFATRFFAERKSAARMALLLGPAFVLRFALGRLGVGEVEALAQRRLGVPVGAVRGCDPGLCYDVDTLDEYRDACARRG